MPAAISVIVPVYNGAALLDRAIGSVLRQSWPDWELIAVDDCSSDDSFALLTAWAEKDPRIRAIRLAENSGASAARNAALRIAGGRMVAYLDHDDEYYPDYFEQVMRHQDRGEVLVFCYDIVVQSAAGERVSSWDPGRVRENLFVDNPVVPLGLAHRRELLEKAGHYNERLWREVDWDFWKRVARAGAAFVFLPFKSGRYHIRPNSLVRVPHLTPRQRQAAVDNWEAGRPILKTLTLALSQREREPELLALIDPEYRVPRLSWKERGPKP